MCIFIKWEKVGAAAFWNKDCSAGGGREKVCCCLRRGKYFRNLGLYGSPPGRSFYSCKRNQNTLGALPQDPCRWLCWIRIAFRQEPKINPYCAQIRSQGSLRRHLPFPPTPFPDAGKGPGWAGKCKAAVRCSGCYGLQKPQAADPWLWLAGLAVCRKREGVPLPRSGGGREGADASAIPY